MNDNFRPWCCKTGVASSYVWRFAEMCVKGGDLQGEFILAFTFLCYVWSILCVCKRKGQKMRILHKFIRRVIIWTYCWCFSVFVSILFALFTLRTFVSHIPIPHFHLTCTLWLSFAPVFFSSSFWWAWEVKMRPWPLVVTGLHLWMERTQRRIHQSLLRQRYAVARPSQA